MNSLEDRNFTGEYVSSVEHMKNAQHQQSLRKYKLKYNEQSLY